MSHEVPAPRAVVVGPRSRVSPGPFGALSRPPHACALSRAARSAAVGIAVWVACLMLGAFPASAQTPIDEAQLKAGFVFRFAQFVEWPEEALAGRDTIDLCVMGPGTYRNALDHLANGETLGGRPLTVRAATTSTVDKCHLLFLPREAPSRRDLLARVADHPVLTVGDDPRFLDDGGIVLLRVVGSHVRFEINAAAARRAALRLSAQLLRLAMTVHGGAP